MPTSRGWACIATGAALLAAGVVLRVPELIETGVTLLVLLCIQLARVWLRRPRYGVHRAVHPPNGIAGTPSTVDVVVERSGRPARAASLHYTDPAPQALGGTRRFDLRLAAGEARHVVRYTVTPVRRGRYVWSGGRLAETDPFGIVRAPEVRGTPSSIVVFPRVEPLAGRSPSGPRPPGGSTSSAASVAAGQEFFATREYRPGDDLRRIHWRSTARMGQLMVRQEELPRRDRATVVLDNRRGSYAPGWEGADAFERAVEAAASLAYHFLALGFSVRLLLTAGAQGAPSGLPPAPARGAAPAPPATAFGRGAAHHTLLMTVLATVHFEAEGPAVPPAAGSAAPPGGGADGGLVVLVGGRPDGAEALRWAEVADSRRSAVVVVPASGETLAAAWDRACAGRGPVRRTARAAGGTP